MDDKNKQKDKTKSKETQNRNTEQKKPTIKDIDDLIFADEYIKHHSEK